MDSKKITRFAILIFSVFLFIQVFIAAITYQMWQNYEHESGEEWNIHFAVGVFIALGGIITFVLVYAQALINLKSADAHDQRISTYKNANIVRNMLGLIPAGTAFSGVWMTGYWPFFIIMAVSLVMQLVYCPTEKRVRREMNLR